MIDEALIDDELTRLALAADPDTPVPADAVPFAAFVADLGDEDDDTAGPPARRRRPRWVKVLIVVVIVAFLVVDAYGLCSTYGIIETA